MVENFHHVKTSSSLIIPPQETDIVPSVEPSHSMAGNSCDIIVRFPLRSTAFH